VREVAGRFRPLPTLDNMAMRNLKFNLFENSGFSRKSRILMFYSFETEANLPRSGILHYNVEERRFQGPHHDDELTAAALDFLARSGRDSQTA
jgi:hypothetical protein